MLVCLRREPRGLRMCSDFPRGPPEPIFQSVLLHLPLVPAAFLFDSFVCLPCPGRQRACDFVLISFPPGPPPRSKYPGPGVGCCKITGFRGFIVFLLLVLGRPTRVCGAASWGFLLSPRGHAGVNFPFSSPGAVGCCTWVCFSHGFFDVVLLCCAGETATGLRCVPIFPGPNEEIATGCLPGAA